ncbi:helix-turn-helix domain containing protein [Microbacter sp. GSS18]|nr:helix-turn-helix domain containing protein [Microbacter sp. GSS18]
MTDARSTTAHGAGYATGRATKRAIVARAAEAFAQHGFYGASLRSIAREAGIDHSTLLHHFGNKTALLLAVLHWHDEQNVPPDSPDLSAVADELTPEQLIEGFVSTARRNAENPGLVQLLSILTAEAGSPDHPARAALKARHDQLTRIIGTMIRRQRDAGRAAADGLSPQERAALVVATWEGLQVYDALHPGELDVPALVEREFRAALGLPPAPPGVSEP